MRGHGHHQRSQFSGETLQFMQRMWDLVHALEVRSKRMARTLGVTGPQRLVIRVVGRSPNSAARDIADMLGIHPSTLTGILRRLELRRVLVRWTDPDDRRRVRFRLTAAGLRIDRERRGTVEAAFRRALGQVDARTVDHTLDLLEVLTHELVRGD